MNNPIMFMAFMAFLLLVAAMAAGGGIQQRHKRRPLSIALAVVAAVLTGVAIFVANR